MTLKECSSVEELKNEVLKEYQKEFYAEGQMYFTYKRIGARRCVGMKNVKSGGRIPDSIAGNRIYLFKQKNI